MVQQCIQQFPPSPITPGESDSSLAIEPLNLQADIAACDKKLAVEERLSCAVHVLATEASALQNLTRFYSSDRYARDGFNRAIETITRRQASGGKLVVIGVGKSGYIAKKLVATFNSLAIQAVFLHPTEALHGDLGQVSQRDTLLLITFSGKTPELLTLLPHLDKSLPLILITSHTRPETCELVRHRPDTILLPAPVHEEETTSFGVPAPTTSTTVALTVGDALAIVASREMHSCVASVFARNHPGGAIGAALRGTKPREDVRSVMVRLEDVSPVHHAQGSLLTGLDVLRAGYASPSGWVKLVPGKDGDNAIGAGTNGVISPRRIRRMDAEDMSRPLDELKKWLVAPRSDFIPVAADTSVQRAAEWIRGLRTATTTATGGDSRNEEGGAYGDEAIVAVMERGECIGLMEVGRLLGES
jgi:D-arabinose 5-phosphate isomerase GutQ